MKSVIAVDPGYDRVGIAVFDENSLIHSECFTPQTNIFTERILDIKKHLQSLMQKHTPSSLAIETLFFNKNHKTALRVAEARGVIQLAAVELSIPVYEYSPQAVKIAVTGSGNADKLSVIKMVERLVALPTGVARHDDELDAIALGIAHQAAFQLSTKLSTGG